MTPDQLAELEVYLAAGFDFPTAVAMITPDDDDSPEPGPDPQPTPRRPDPSASDYFMAGCVALVLFVTALISIWLFGG